MRQLICLFILSLVLPVLGVLYSPGVGQTVEPGEANTVRDAVCVTTSNVNIQVCYLTGESHWTC
jgi:hypothetical protein